MRRRGKREGEEILTHIDMIDDMRNNGDSSRWIRRVDCEEVGSEITGDFWILGDGELVGELLFIYLDLCSITDGARGCGAGGQVDTRRQCRSSFQTAKSRQ